MTEEEQAELERKLAEYPAWRRGTLPAEALLAGLVRTADAPRQAVFSALTGKERPSVYGNEPRLTGADILDYKPGPDDSKGEMAGNALVGALNDVFLDPLLGLGVASKGIGALSRALGLGGKLEATGAKAAAQHFLRPLADDAMTAETGAIRPTKDAMGAKGKAILAKYGIKGDEALRARAAAQQLKQPPPPRRPPPELEEGIEAAEKFEPPSVRAPGGSTQDLTPGKVDRLERSTRAQGIPGIGDTISYLGPGAQIRRMHVTDYNPERGRYVGTDMRSGERVVTDADRVSEAVIGDRTFVYDKGAKEKAKAAAAESKRAVYDPATGTMKLEAGAVPAPHTGAKTEEFLGDIHPGEFTWTDATGGVHRSEQEARRAAVAPYPVTPDMNLAQRQETLAKRLEAIQAIRKSEKPVPAGETIPSPAAETRQPGDVSLAQQLGSPTIKKVRQPGPGMEAREKGFLGTPSQPRTAQPREAALVPGERVLFGNQAGVMRSAKAGTSVVEIGKDKFITVPTDKLRRQTPEQYWKSSSRLLTQEGVQKELAQIDAERAVREAKEAEAKLRKSTDRPPKPTAQDIEEARKTVEQINAAQKATRVAAREKDFVNFTDAAGNKQSGKVVKINTGEGENQLTQVQLGDKSIVEVPNSALEVVGVTKVEAGKGVSGSVLGNERGAVTFSVGDPVRVRDRAGTKVPGKIAAVLPDGGYEVSYTGEGGVPAFRKVGREDVFGAEPTGLGKKILKDERGAVGKDLEASGDPFDPIGATRGRSIITPEGKRINVEGEQSHGDVIMQNYPEFRDYKDADSHDKAYGKFFKHGGIRVTEGALEFDPMSAKAVANAIKALMVAGPGKVKLDMTKFAYPRFADAESAARWLEKLPKDAEELRRYVSRHVARSAALNAEDAEVSAATMARNRPKYNPLKNEGGAISFRRKPGKLTDEEKKAYGPEVDMPVSHGDVVTYELAGDRFSERATSMGDTRYTEYTEGGPIREISDPTVLTHSKSLQGDPELGTVFWDSVKNVDPYLQDPKKLKTFPYPFEGPNPTSTDMLHAAAHGSAELPPLANRTYSGGEAVLYEYEPGKILPGIVDRIAEEADFPGTITLYKPDGTTMERGWFDPMLVKSVVDEAGPQGKRLKAAMKRSQMVNPAAQKGHKHLLHGLAGALGLGAASATER